MASTAVIRIVRLTMVDPGRYFACSLSEILLADPLETVLCQLRTANCSIVGAKQVLTFPEKFAELLEKISADPEQWLQAKATKDGSIDGPGEVEASAKVWVPAMSSRSIQGSRNIEDFLSRLPGAYKAAGFDILDGEGKIVLGDTSVRYDAIAMRAAEFFDVSFATVSAKNFGRSVLAELAAVVPRDHSSASQLKKLCRRIDEVATPATLDTTWLSVFFI